LTDYYSILSRAVASLDPNTTQARSQLFNRARQLLLERIQDSGSRWTDADAEAEIARFEAATDRIESDMARRRTGDPIGQPRQRPPAEPAVHTRRSMGRVAVLSAAGLVGVLLIGLAVYAFRGGEVATTKPGGMTTVTAKQDAGTKAPPRTDVGDDLEPGIDGGSTDSGLPYFLRRQAVYYRTVYTAGMIVVDRSQRFLYLVQPQSRAIRYGIGVGGECSVNAGLYRIQSKSQWPEWSPSPTLLKRRAYPARVPGGPGNPLGAYVMYFESHSPGIHGTNAPRSIGQAPVIGCFRLVNDDVVDLEKRVPVGTGVVVLN